MAALRKIPKGSRKTRGVAGKVAVRSFDAQQFLMSAGTGRSAGKCPSGKTIFQQGDTADALFFLRKGKVKITVVSEQGREAVVAILSAGAFFGEGCLAGQPRHMATATSIAECTIVRIEKETMIRILHEEPKFSEMFMAFLLARNIEFEADLVDLLFNSCERRLARTLLMLANFGKEGKLQAVIPPITQDVLAARVGTTRPRINFFMNKFRKLGLIEYNGHLKVHSSLLNILVHD